MDTGAQRVGVFVLIFASSLLLAVACGDKREVHCTNVESILKQYESEPVNAPLRWEDGRHCIEIRVDEVTGEGRRGYKVIQNRDRYGVVAEVEIDRQNAAIAEDRKGQVVTVRGCEVEGYKNPFFGRPLVRYDCDH